MKRVVVIVGILLFSAVAFGEDPNIELMPGAQADLPSANLPDFSNNVTLPTKDMIQHPDKVIERVMKETVMLTLNERSFCSGVIAKDPQNQTYIYTAAHCCDVWSEFGEKAAVTYDGVKLTIGDIERADNCDACRVKFTGGKTRTDVKIANREDKRNLFTVSPYPLYSPTERVVRLVVMGQTFENEFHIITSADVHPGMSGSPVIDIAGNVVGFAIAHFLNTPYPNCIISEIDGTPFMTKEIR